MSQLRSAMLVLLLLTLVTGVGYPLLTTGLAQWLFPAQANGSLIEQHGSALIGQNFTRLGYFWGRPSATGDRRPATGDRRLATALTTRRRRAAATWRQATRRWTGQWRNASSR
nr:Potassium-transporting ATPase C chain [Candidatus Pantoea persica]